MTGRKVLERAVLPSCYENYVFDLYGTLVDIHTDEDLPQVWQKLALFLGYYGAAYQPGELEETYHHLIAEKEKALFRERGEVYSHEASPEIEITDVFHELFTGKGIEADDALAVHAGQLFRVESTAYVRTYPGTEALLADLNERGRKVWLLSNAQRIFTEYEMRYLAIAQYFDGILISSDYRTKKPDQRFFGQLGEQFGVRAEGTLFIGNDSKADIGGAIAAGYDTFYVYSAISPEKDALLLERDGIPADYIVKDFERWEGIS